MKQVFEILTTILSVVFCGRKHNTNAGQSSRNIEEKIKEQTNMVEVYTEKEMRMINSHIEENFGTYKTVLHEIVSPDIHVDICVVEPTKNRNYYTLVTMGMGAHKMNVPAALKSNKIDRAELLITLPPDWNLDLQDLTLQNSYETSYWVIRWLKVMARLPVEQNTWLGWGHTVPNGEPFAENTKLCGMYVTMPYFFGNKSAICTLPNKEEVHFYQLVPLYGNEMQYKIENGAEALENSFSEDFDMVVDISRKKFV